jgi:hypothetical protein
VHSRRYTFVLHHDRSIGRWTMLRSPLRIRLGLTISTVVQYVLADIFGSRGWLRIAWHG